MENEVKESPIFNSKRIIGLITTTAFFFLAKFGIIITPETATMLSSTLDAIYGAIVVVIGIVTKILDNWKANRKEPKFSVTDFIFFWRLFRS